MCYLMLAGAPKECMIAILQLAQLSRHQDTILILHRCVAMYEIVTDASESYNS